MKIKEEIGEKRLKEKTQNQRAVSVKKLIR